MNPLQTQKKNKGCSFLSHTHTPLTDHDLETLSVSETMPQAPKCSMCMCVCACTWWSLCLTPKNYLMRRVERSVVLSPFKCIHPGKHAHQSPSYATFLLHTSFWRGFLLFRLHMQGSFATPCCCLVACSVVWALLFGAVGLLGADYFLSWLRLLFSISLFRSSNGWGDEMTICNDFSSSFLSFQVDMVRKYRLAS